MIRYLTHNQIDKSCWDDCIANSPNGLVYVWSWYLDAVHPGWEALVEDDYQTVMPLCGNKKFGINYLFQPYFTQKSGVISRSALSEAKIEEFLNAIPSKFKFAQIRLVETGNPNNSQYIIDNHRNIELDLNQDYSTLHDNYHSNTKRNLAKAEKDKLTVDENAEPLEIIKLFRENRGREITKWGDVEYSRLINLVTEAKKREKCLVYGVKNPDNQLVAGAFFMLSHGKTVFLFSGAAESNKDNHGLTFLLDYVIRKYASTPNVLDFEGSDNDGLARFYKGFGGKEYFYKELRFNKLNIFTKFALTILKRNKI